MTKQPEALRIADALEKLDMVFSNEISAELRRLHEVNVELLTIIKDLQESAGYWSEYDVPLGIVDRINAAVKKATGETE
jgi:hypothetical protein